MNEWTLWLLLCTESYFVAIFPCQGSIPIVLVVFFLSGFGEMTPSLNRVSSHFISILQNLTSEVIHSQKRHTMNIGPIINGYGATDI
jgi:hypothetical protein